MTDNSVKRKNVLAQGLHEFFSRHLDTAKADVDAAHTDYRKQEAGERVAHFSKLLKALGAK